MSALLVFAVLIIYIALLFALAWTIDKRAQKPLFRRNPYIYALALGVYCTSWTYFGAVGTAATAGFEFLPIYLGPIIVFTVYGHVVRRIAHLTNREKIASIADFLASRYGKSQGLGALATVCAIFGVLPYIALQLKSIGMSFNVLIEQSSNTSTGVDSHTIVIIGIALSLFTVIFGARNSDISEKNTGLMHVLAFESFVKLVGLIAVSTLCLWFFFEGQSKFLPLSVFTDDMDTPRFITITLLSMAAIICLPRQFHVNFVEYNGREDLKYARWVFPIYLIITSAVVIPIALVGLDILPNRVSPDTYVLAIPIFKGNEPLAIFVFLGGFSAASAMVIMSCTALSSMVTLNLIVPIRVALSGKNAFSEKAKYQIILIRRLSIFLLMALALLYYFIGGSSQALAQSGLISFAAAIQFAPGLLLGIYWQRANRTGVFAGLLMGQFIWFYTLVLPTLVPISILEMTIPAFLNPHALLGIGIEDSLTHGVFWSLAINFTATILISIYSKERLRDRVQSLAFTNIYAPERNTNFKENDFLPLPTVKIGGLKTLASRFMPEEAVSEAFLQLGHIHENDLATWVAIDATEKLLGRAIGASSARVVLASAISGKNVSFEDMLTILDQETQSQQFDRHMLQAMLESIPQGISVVDYTQRLVAWNSAYANLFDYPKELLKTGQPISELIAYNISRGWISGDPDSLMRKRLSHMQDGKPYSYERKGMDGNWLRIVGNPMPGGGYVSSFHDITEDYERAEFLKNANILLEKHVEDRTYELKHLNDALDSARKDAEGANASKTRFLAAASHDLLQPLNAARLFLGAASGTDVRKVDMEILRKVDRCIESADQLIRGLLDIAKLDHGNLTVNTRIFPIGPMIEDLTDEAEPMAKQAGLYIRAIPSSYWVNTDPNFLASILRNFISNARRYTKTGGILIGVRKRNADLAKIEVWDTGPGIESDKIGQLFDEFQRLDETDNLGVRGVGLGLSIARRLAEIINADISVRSWPQYGSVFAIKVPLARPQSYSAISESTPKSVKAVIDLAHLSILCLDDEVVILDAMYALLSSWSIRVFLANNEKKAMHILREESIDIVLADYSLGNDITSQKIIEHILLEYTGIRCILLSAKTSQDIYDFTNNHDLTLLHKPVNPDKLKALLNQNPVHFD